MSLEGVSDGAAGAVGVAQSPPPAGGASAWLAVGVFMLLYMLAYLDRLLLLLLVDPIRRDFGASDMQIGFLQGLAFVVSYALCGLPLGWAVDRFPRRWIIFVGIEIWSIAAAGAGLARQFWQLVLSRLGVGAGEAALAPAVYSILADLFPPNRLALPMAIFTLGSVMGQGVSFVLGGLIVSWAAHASITLPLVGALRSWQIAFLITGAPGLLLGLLVFAVTEPRRAKPPPRAASATGVLGQFRAHPGFYASHFAAFTLMSVVYAGWNGWGPSFLMRIHGWPVARVGLTMGAVSVAGGTVGLLLSGALVDWLYRRGVRDAHLRIYVFGALGMAAAGVSAALARSDWVLYASMFLVATIGAYAAVAAAVLQIVTPAQMRGRVSTIFLLIYTVVSNAVGPLSIPFMTEKVFHDPAKMPVAIATHFVVFASLAALTFLAGLKPLRRAMASVAPG
jgi:MFS family permease